MNDTVAVMSSVIQKPVIKGPFKLSEERYEKLMGRMGYGEHTSLALFLRLMSYFKRYWVRATLAIGIALPIGALDGAIAYSIKPFIDALRLESGHFNVTLAPMMILGFTMLQGILNYFSIYLNGWVGARIMNDLQYDLFAKLQTLDTTFFGNNSAGFLIQRFYRDPESLQKNVLTNIKQVLSRIASAIGLSAVLIATSWQLSIVAISISLAILLPSIFVKKKLKEIANETTEVDSDILSFYTEVGAGIKIVSSYNMQQTLLANLDKLQRHIFGRRMKSIQIQGWLMPSMHTIAAIGIVLIIWQGSTMVQAKTLTVGSFASFMAAMLMLYNPIKNLGNSVVNTQFALFAAERIFRILDWDPWIQDRPGAATVQTFDEEIRYNNVSFVYNDDHKEIEENWVLKHIDLTLKKGETVALVGASGGGKSTLVHLLTRFFEVRRGSITIDGVDIRDITLHSLRDLIGVVLQDNFLFSGTIRDNLAAGKPGATEAQMLAALDKAYLTDFVNQLPNGLDTVIGERGGLISGGQRQRLGIARAILKNAPILILDEATSSLDNEAEAIVQKAMESLMTDKTVIVIAHRLSTIRHADRIVVMRAGRIIEQGSHAQLLSRDADYARLYYTQFHQDELSLIQSHRATEKASS